MQVLSWLLVAAVLIMALLLFWLLVPRIRKQRGDVPDDGLELDSRPHPFNFQGSPGNPINDQIVNTVNSMGGVGERAEQEYQANLDRLRGVADEAVKHIEAAYRSVSEADYVHRWSLVQLLTDIRHRASIPVLDAVVSSPIPPERSKAPHSFTSVGEEVMIRTTAVEGLTRLAADGEREALGILLKHSRHENFSVKRASIQGYLAHGGETARDELLKILPESERTILDIRPANVREIEQAEPRRTLKAEKEEDLPRIRSPKPERGA